MVVETEAALRQQTLSHFIHTFIRNYDRESAADRTMRSQYVPRNIKLQLLAAIRDCRVGSGDDTVKISGIADMGLFIDASCNEIVYYHSITSSVLQWTLSLYVHDAHVRNVIKTVLDDMGRIGDDDVQFILEKYRYNEERRLAGDPLDRTGVDRVLSFLKPKKFQPGVSYFSYYTQSVMLKLARSLLQNSAVFLNGGGRGAAETAESAYRATSRNDNVTEEDERLYEDYRRHRETLATLAADESLEKMRRVLDRGTVSGEGPAMRRPPETPIATPFDRTHASDAEDEYATDDPTVDYFERHDRPVCGSDRSVDDERRSPPHTREDREVELIMGRELVPLNARRSNDDTGHVLALREIGPSEPHTTALLAMQDDTTLSAARSDNPCDGWRVTDTASIDEFLGEVRPYDEVLSSATVSNAHTPAVGSSSVIQSTSVSDLVIREDGVTTSSGTLATRNAAASYMKRVTGGSKTLTTTVRRVAMSRELRGVLKKERLARVLRCDPIDRFASSAVARCGHKRMDRVDDGDEGDEREPSTPTVSYKFS